MASKGRTPPLEKTTQNKTRKAWVCAERANPVCHLSEVLQRHCSLRHGRGCSLPHEEDDEAQSGKVNSGHFNCSLIYRCLQVRAAASFQ
jgi:hypothetical protein